VSVVQLTINRHRAEMSDINVKLIYEQQKTERQAATIEQYSNQVRDLNAEVKASLICSIIL